MWFAVCADEKPSYGKTLEKTRENGYSHKELRKFKVARILREAFEQKVALSQADVAEMLGVSTGTVSRDIREYQIENQVVLPYRGTMHDLGRAINHFYKSKPK